MADGYRWCQWRRPLHNQALTGQRPPVPVTHGASHCRCARSRLCRLSATITITTTPLPHHSSYPTKPPRLSLICVSVAHSLLRCSRKPELILIIHTTSENKARIKELTKRTVKRANHRQSIQLQPFVLLSRPPSFLSPLVQSLLLTLYLQRQQSRVESA